MWPAEDTEGGVILAVLYTKDTTIPNLSVTQRTSNEYSL